MLKTVCMFCKKEFTIGDSDYQYLRIKHRESNFYVCRMCSFSLQKEAIATSGIKSDDIEPKIDKIFR